MRGNPGSETCPEPSPWSDNRKSFDHLTRAHQDVGRYRDADLLGSFQIDDHFEIARHLDWQISRFGTFENPIDVPSTSPSQSVIVRTVVQKSPELSYCKRTTTAQCDLFLSRRFGHVLSHVPEYRGAYRKQTIRSISGDSRDDLFHIIDRLDRFLDYRYAQLRCYFLK